MLAGLNCFQRRAGPDVHHVDLVGQFGQAVCDDVIVESKRSHLAE
jgi:hypothetical protein